MFGLSNEQFEILKKIVIDPLKKEGARVFVYGSRARGKHHEFSDIDILFEEVDGRAIDPIVLSKIKEEIEESHLAIAVDLVNSKDLAESYRAQVEQDRILV